MAAAAAAAAAVCLTAACLTAAGACLTAACLTAAGAAAAWLLMQERDAQEASGGMVAGPVGLVNIFSLLRFVDIRPEPALVRRGPAHVHALLLTLLPCMHARAHGYG